MKNTKFDEIRNDIALICDYLAVDEKRHYEESGRPKNHIWCYIRRTRQWLKEKNTVRTT